ncbi:MAG: hemerythrin domain-containing protein [Thermoplasmatota archaeon]
MKISEITESLRSYLSGEITEKETAEKIKSASPSELSLAEIRLMSEGYKEEDLKDISKVFLSVIEDKKQRYKNKLEDGHPVKRFIIDHEKILKRMAEIEDVLSKDESLKYGDFKHIKNSFEEFEKHHENEEKTILPILKDNGKRGRVNLVKNEHRKIEKKEDKIKDILGDEDPEKALTQAKELRYLLSKHTVMENNYLYPLAIEKIDDWRPIKDKMELMGSMKLED